jgi:23S rRNA-/tRNA-specific pseudouridylate synthase
VQRWRGSYAAVAHHRSLVPGWVTTMELSPVTGRTHQLRRHMLHLGHPILGDTQYGVEGTTLSGCVAATAFAVPPLPPPPPLRPRRSPLWVCP